MCLYVIIFHSLRGASTWSTGQSKLGQMSQMFQATSSFSLEKMEYSNRNMNVIVCDFGFVHVGTGNAKVHTCQQQLSHRICGDGAGTAAKDERLPAAGHCLCGQGQCKQATGSGLAPAALPGAV